MNKINGWFLLILLLSLTSSHNSQAASCGANNKYSCNQDCAEVAAARCKKNPSWTTADYNSSDDEGVFEAMGLTPADCCHRVAFPLSGQGDWSRCGAIFGFTSTDFESACKGAL